MHAKMFYSKVEHIKIQFSKWAVSSFLSKTCLQYRMDLMLKNLSGVIGILMDFDDPLI